MDSGDPLEPAISRPVDDAPGVVDGDTASD